MQLSVNGVDTFIATGGRDFDASLPTVVMLHGAGFDSSTWCLQSRWLAHRGHNVLAPDLPSIDSILTDVRFLRTRGPEAIFEMSRSDAGTLKSFEVRFHVDADGFWRLRSF